MSNGNVNEGNKPFFEVENKYSGTKYKAESIEDLYIKISKIDNKSLNDILDEYIDENDELIAVVQQMNELKFGYYCNSKFKFANDDNLDIELFDELDEKYLIQLRLFNDKEEIFIQKDNDNKVYHVRIIFDNKNPRKENDFINLKKVDTVNNPSDFIGKKVIFKNDFAKLEESGRKLKMVIPAKRESKYYSLTTRSYILYDKETGQAGYAFYRYFSIESKSYKE